MINTDPNLIPEEGETITARGGLGNKVLHQSKKENGIYYKRSSEEEEWTIDNPHEKMLQFIKEMTINVLEKPKPKSKFSMFFNKFFK
jgi:hypothetical protein